MKYYKNKQKVRGLGHGYELWRAERKGKEYSFVTQRGLEMYSCERHEEEEMIFTLTRLGYIGRSSYDRV